MMKLGDVATRIDCALEGPRDLEVSGVAGLEDATPHDLSFLANPKYRSKAETTRAAAVIVASNLQGLGKPLLRASDPYLAFARAMELFYSPRPPQPGIHPTAIISPTASIGERASIGPYAVIEDDVTLGEDCVLKSFVSIYAGAKIGDRFYAHSHAVVREGVQIGNGVILQNGVVVGADGFGFARQPDGSYCKIRQPGSVLVEDEVEIQANSCIDRPSVGITRLRRGVKVDNLVQVGHGCDVGENTLLCAQVGLAGSSKLGRNVIMTGQVGVAGHLTIGDNVVATPQTGIPNDVSAGSVISGSPAIDHALWLKCAAAYSRLPELLAKVRRVREYLNKLGANV
jgi:UDP-3-O-[3-hydroxymyristoyl] glucosamine N-acyltransferase